MKKIIYALSIIILPTLSLFAQNETLRGDEAITKLKQTGQYTSLMEAFRDVRKDNGQAGGQPNQPTVAITRKVLASDGEAFDEFGFSVALSGDTAIIGARKDDVGANIRQGSAYVFIRSGTDWIFQQKLTASDGAENDTFGESVSISGDTAIVGAPAGQVNGIIKGSAYVFVRSGTTWTQQAKLTAPDGAEFDGFCIVAISGDTAIVGAYGDDIGEDTNQGSAYVFVRNGTNWIFQAKLTASDGEALDYFGYSLSISGDTAIISASEDHVGDNVDQGSAYVFVRNGAFWTQQQKLTASDGEAFDYFGIGISISGDTAIVSSLYDDVGDNERQGSAYVFVRNGTTWTQQQKLTASDGEAFDYFGYSASISDDIAIIGTSDNSAYVFTRSGGVWTELQQLTASDGEAFDHFGWSVAVSGSNIVIGAVGDDVNGNTDQGSAYFGRVLGNGWTQEEQIIPIEVEADDEFGDSVALSGNTAIIGAPEDNVGTNIGQGSAYVFVRNGSTWTQQAHLIDSDGADADYFGESVAIDGDTAIVGAPGGDRAYIFVRSGTAWTQQGMLLSPAGNFFGESVAIDGNTVIVGAPRADVVGDLDQGLAYVFVRSSTQWNQQGPPFIDDLEGAAGDFFGTSVAISGDTAIIGAPGTDIGGQQVVGSAYVWVRSNGLWLLQQKLDDPLVISLTAFGTSVAIDGNTAIVGAPGTIGGGRAYAFVRNGADWKQQGNPLTVATGGYFGGSVAIEGNIAVIGDPEDDVGMNSNQGSAYVFTLSGANWIQQSQLNGAGGAANDNFGRSVAISGDLICAGVPFSEKTPLVPNGTNEGAAVVFVNTPLAPTAAPFDFDGDGKTDISIFRPSVGEWWINRSSTSQVVAGVFGNSSDKIVPADFTGDGKSDLAVWRGSTGEWFILRSEDASYYSVPFGLANDIPAPADFDGDGKADLSVFRPSNGTWFINKSSGGTDIVTFGQAGDVPVVGDYDGDGKVDIAIFRPSNGQWWLSRSTAGIVAATFGVSTDKPVPGDFTGDGKTDLAFWRPSTGEWFILRSEDSSYFSVPFGASGDIPTPGDFDGDGKTDTAVFRGGVWYVQRSTSGILIQQFGLADDKPVPSAFVP